MSAARNEKIPEWLAKGYLKQKDLKTPSKEELAEGALAVIECPQRIPCDPCSENCPVGAIEMDDINSFPEIDYDSCIGCAICVENCPGLAIFMVDCSFEEGCEITIPYEFHLPKVGEEVEGLNRKGEKVTEAEVTKVKTKERSSGDTSTVTVKVPEEYANEVRNIRRIK